MDADVGKIAGDSYIMRNSSVLVRTDSCLHEDKAGDFIDSTACLLITLFSIGYF